MLNNYLYSLGKWRQGVTSGSAYEQTSPKPSYSPKRPLLVLLFSGGTPFKAILCQDPSEGSLGLISQSEGCDRTTGHGKH